MNFRLSLTDMPYEELNEEQKRVLEIYDGILKYREYFICNKDISSLFTVKSDCEGLYFLNENIKKNLFDNFVFGFKFFTSYYIRNGVKKGQVGFESKNYGIFRTESAIQNFRRGLFIGYIKDKNLVYCNPQMAYSLNELFKYYNKDIFLSLGFDENVYKIFDYNLDWYSLGEIQELYKKIRKQSKEPLFKQLSGDEIIKLLEENGYSMIKIKSSNSRFIPLEERKNYPIADKGGTKRYFVKNKEQKQ